MPTIIALPSKSATLTINGAAINVESVEFTIKSQVLQYGVTGGTADADGNYWLECITGMNDATVTMSAPLNYAADVDARLTGSDLGLVPGTTGSGTLLLTFAAGATLSCAIVISEISPSVDVMGSKPIMLRVSATVNGAITRGAV